jgi:very-short-patch-repair endonuclease
MAYGSVHASDGDIWALVERQHGVVSHRQLLGLGLSPAAVKHRIAAGRLFGVHRGVYAVGRPQLGPHGLWTAAVLACGSGAVLSHLSALCLWGLWTASAAPIEVSVPVARRGHRPGLIVHRRRAAALEDATSREGVPLTAVTRTIIDVAPRIGAARLERIVGEADKLGLSDPEQIRAAAARAPRLPGSAIVRRRLDLRTFRLTESELERRFLSLVGRAGIDRPETGARIGGHKVDFLWPRLGLVVETDGLRYHRTAAQQTVDRRRDQRLTEAGLTLLRFTHAQVRYERDEVERTLRAVVSRLTTE